MERDPRVDPQFGDELGIADCERFGYTGRVVMRVAARGLDGHMPTVEVLTRREAGTYWRHMSLSVDVYAVVASGATVTRTGGEG